MENAMKIDPRRVKITTAPAAEPITTTEAKLHCRVDHATEDAIFTRLIEVARNQCEAISGRSFITRTYTAYLDNWPYMTRFELPYPPLASITSVKYYDDAGSSAVTFASSNYEVDTNSEPGRFALKSTASWPSTTLRELNGVEIIYTAGYGASADAVPDQYKQAMLLLIGHLYENRESVVIQQGVSLVQVPQAVEWLLLTDRAY
jgi:uncharacterized phiE125 gp8 family phage protein